MEGVYSLSYCLFAYDTSGRVCFMDWIEIEGETISQLGCQLPKVCMVPRKVPIRKNIWQD